MFNLKQISLSVATIAATVTISAVCSTTAQAAIVGGRVSGTWQAAAGGVNGLDVGTAFTADYTYDSASLVTTDVASFNPSYSRYLVNSAPLLSLVVNSGAFNYAFNPGRLNSFNQFDIQGGPASPQYASTGFSLYASEFSGQSVNTFSVGKFAGQFDNNKPFEDILARFYIDDNGNFNDGYSSYAQTNAIIDGSLPPSGTPVPTPALLPGLVGLGAAALRKRKKQGQEVAETAQS